MDAAFEKWFAERWPTYGYNGEDGSRKEATREGWQACADLLSVVCECVNSGGVPK